MSSEFFPQRPKQNPTIYAYEIIGAENRKGLLKVGFTNRDARERIKEQLGTSGLKYKIVLEQSAIRNDGSTFLDHEVHKYLKKKGFKNPDGEWFECSVKDVNSAILAIKNGFEDIQSRTLDFGMRPEQSQAVDKTIRHFKSFKEENPTSIPHFLWNAKMRFGKTFASYQLAKKMNWKKILVLTFKPAVQSAWREDLATHIDFEGWQFVSKGGLEFEDTDQTYSMFWFISRLSR